MDEYEKFCGEVGEDIAVDYLEKQGYKIVERNFNTKIGEVDIIAQDKDEVVFVEVRSLKGNSVVDLEETVNFRKQKKLQKAAECYLLKFKEEPYCRFDVIAIRSAENSNRFSIKHIKDAFYKK